MGLGSTAKKIQKVADIAEQLYTKVNELKSELDDLRGTVESTNERVEDIDETLARQQALIEALAEERDIDTDGLVERVETGETDGTATPTSDDATAADE